MYLSLNKNSNICYCLQKTKSIPSHDLSPSKNSNTCSYRRQTAYTICPWAKTANTYTADSMDISHLVQVNLFCDPIFILEEKT